MVSQKISKEVFISVIEHLHQQYLQDKEYVEGISALYGTDMPFYDNSHLLKSSLELLRVFFPKDENGFCDIEFFCYVCDFGKIGDVKDAEELWGVLVGRVKPEQILFAMAKKVSDSFGLPRETIVEVIRISESDGSVVKKTMTFGEWLSYKKLPGFIYRAYQLNFSQYGN